MDVTEVQPAEPFRLTPDPCRANTEVLYLSALDGTLLTVASVTKLDSPVTTAELQEVADRLWFAPVRENPCR